MNKPWLNHYEVGVPEAIAYPPVPLFYLLRDSAARRPDHPALVFYGKTISYRELSTQVNQFARALLGLGLRKGDRVAVMLPNVPQCVIAYYGVLAAGGVVVMTNPLYIERELQVQLADSGAKIIVALDFMYPKIEKIRVNTALTSIILTSVKDELPWMLALLYPLKARREGQWIQVPKSDTVRDLFEVMAGYAATPPVIEAVGPNDLALLQYTGGTTGTPKGVMLSHRNLVANTLQCRHWMPTLTEADIFLAVVPFFHVYGMSTCMNLALSLGGTLVLLPRFVTKDVLGAIQKHRATIFMGVQAMYVAVNSFSKVKDYDLSSIAVCISGAGPLHVEVQRQFEALTGGKLVEGYGLSEAAPVTHCNPINGVRREGSIGLPFPDTLAQIVDGSGKPLAQGEVGELIVAGPQVMSGYWKKPEESAAVLRDGWLYTGDMARMDEEGYFSIVDRKKDMIKTRGENVYPREVEEALYRHPKVKEAVVIGLPDLRMGEIIKAYLVLKDGETATEAEIVQFCRAELTHFKVPQRIEFRKELPKTIIGKVLRRVLLAEEAAKNL
jgi:long-chain acyl-CoA synthetase